MMPSHYECPTLEQIAGTGNHRGWHHLYPARVAASSDSLLYDNGFAMSCMFQGALIAAK